MGRERAKGSSPVMGVSVSESTPVALGPTWGWCRLIRATVVRGRGDRWCGSSVRAGGTAE